MNVSARWPREVLADEGWRAPTAEERDAMLACAKAHHSEALVMLASEDRDVWTECGAGHPQVGIDDCDGVHCHRSCDETARTTCRRMWKMRIDR